MFDKEYLKKWIEHHSRYLNYYTGFCLSSKNYKKRPKLELSYSDGDSYTNGQIVHIGLLGLLAETDEELMTMTLFRIGHEVQHCLSTTSKAWEFGILTGYHLVCEALSRVHEPIPRRFRKEADYDRFLEDLRADDICVSKQAILKFSHFICNSVEDGRIERIRCMKRPGFKDYIVFCRGREWKEYPLPDEMINNMDDTRNHLTVVLNQVLNLATMGIYQKRFLEAAAQGPETHKLVQTLILEISKAVFSRTCREAMEHAIEITRILADEIAEASTLNDFEKIMNEIIKAVCDKGSYNADSRDEETGDGSAVSYFDNSVISEGSDKKPSKGSGKISKKDDESKTGSEPDAKSIEEAISSAMDEAMEEAGDNVEDDAKNAISASDVDKGKQGISPVTSTAEDYIPISSDVEEDYSYEVKFEEKTREYTPDNKWESELASEANVLKRKVDKIFNNMESPTMRAQNKGSIDPGRLFKLAMGEMDCFKKKQTIQQSDWCAYFLLDNSGSMGPGYDGDKKYYACRALSVIEHAFQDYMPLKITAFDADGSHNVRHEVIKNWSEKVHANASYNFLTKGYTGWGNKDGYSISIASPELMKKSEKKKLLVILSDGLPTDYDSSIEAYSDVERAVKDAVKNGIEVFSIYFGEPRTDIIRKFEEMYGDVRSITVAPSQITDVLIKKMKRFCFRK